MNGSVVSVQVTAGVTTTGSVAVAPFGKVARMVVLLALNPVT